MLKKLIKHEWAAVWKLPAILNLCLAGITILGALSFLLPVWTADEFGLAQAAVFLLIMFYYLSLIGISIAVMLYLVIRYYKNMYTDEGYLTHTLPVSAHHLVISKAVVAFTWQIITCVVIVVSVITLVLSALSVFDDSFSLGELFRGLGSILREFKQQFGFSLGLYSVFLLLCMLVSCLNSIMSLYGCISLGQLMGKHKILGAIGAYFGFYMIVQFVGTLFLIPQTTAQFTSMIESDSGEFMHRILYGTTGTMTAIMLVLALGFYFLSVYVAKKKLNLD